MSEFATQEDGEFATRNDGALANPETRAFATLKTSEFANINALWAGALMEVLVANGVRRLVLSPGSRSAPLAVAAEAHPQMDVVVIVDERSAAFFALGQALGDGGPVAIACTSGTAAANYLPAVIEASQARVPLIVLTADRPPSLRGLGAAQTINQIHLYGHAVRHFQELPLPSLQATALAAMTTQVALAVAAARTVPAGPVHLNVPFEEPLAPIAKDIETVALLHHGRGHVPRVALPTAQASQMALKELAERLFAASRPVLVAGPNTTDAGGAALLAWASATGMPVVADIGSGLRGLKAGLALVVSHADAFLREPEFKGPDLVIRVGGAPTAKGVALYLLKHNAPTIALQPDVMGRDGDVAADLIVVGDVADAATRLTSLATASLAAGRSPLVESDWSRYWHRAEGATAELITQGDLVPDEALALLAAARSLPVNGNLCLSNSLPVRHAETFWGAKAARGRRAFSFRGANGIDGVTSQALGIARATRAPTLLVTGDLAALHDLGGLAAARCLETPLVLLVLNNDGGGIFSLLPVAQSVPAFEPLFGTPHGHSFAHAAALFGLPYSRCEDPAEVAAAAALAYAHPGVTLIEFVCNRARTASAQQAFMARAAAGLAVVR
jgi:2-succinyl-5-enolpyruvyl-6-hydroxy-3-cyclohexene-1-carboxylate synthase